MVHDALALYVTEDTYTIANHDDGDKPSEAIIIDRDTGLFTLEKNIEALPSEAGVVAIQGIFGVVSLLSGDYLILIGERQSVGRLNGHEIYQAKKIAPIRISRNYTMLTKQQYDDEMRYVSMMESLFNVGRFYFSYTYDLTQTMQRQMQCQVHLESLWQRADGRFFWNRHLQSKLIDITERDPDQNMSDFILPVIHGFLEICPTQIHTEKIIFAVVSRRSRFRNGTRYFSRGLDNNGNVSNFVETEQIVLLGPEGRTRLSYVQTRGSVPIFWAQVNTLKYTPRLQIMYLPETTEKARLHFEEQIRAYGPQLLVNLTNKKGYEVPVGEAYSNTFKELEDLQLHYYHFDFHHECRNMQWDRINVLIDLIKERLIVQSYFHAEQSDLNSLQIRKEQTSVIRTNCMDCLDRTNVVQSTFALWMLNRALCEIKLIDQEEPLEKIPEFMNMFRNVWADNADAISSAYSGSGALKTDFTRTGTRTKQGALNDFRNSIQRYVMNNFLDGKRQVRQRPRVVVA